MSRRKKRKSAAVKKQTRAPQQSFLQKNLIAIVLILVLIFISVIRLRLLDVPLERDEGEYAYFAQLILKGAAPYNDAYSMKFPGTYFIYALFILILGHSAAALHFGLLLVNLATILSLYFLVKKLMGEFAGLISAAVFGVLSVSDAVLGFAGHATHFVLLVAIPGIYFLLRAFAGQKTVHFLVAGILLGLVPIFKQSGVFFPIFGLTAFVIHFLTCTKSERMPAIRGFGLFVAGGLIPAAVLFFYLLAIGSLENFWFWTIKYPFMYGGQVTFEKGMQYFTDHFMGLTQGFVLLWVLIAAGLPLLFFTKFRMKSSFAIPFILLFFLLSVSTIIPGYYFRHHYFVSMLPAVAILAGVSFEYIRRISKKFMSHTLAGAGAFIFFLVVMGIGIGEKQQYYFVENPGEISRRIYGLNPFVESEAIGDFIRRNSDEGDKIAVIGSEPQIYFFAERESATGFIYMYPLMEDHEYNLEMQEQMINEIETSEPEVIVMVDITASWLKKPASPIRIFRWWMQKAADDNYRMLGVVEIFFDATLYKFSVIALQHQRESKYRVRIYKKKS